MTKSTMKKTVAALIAFIVVHRAAQAAFGHIPDPTVALLFAVGVCGAPASAFAATAGVVVGIDALGLFWGRSACLSPAYPLVLAALLGAWVAGRVAKERGLPFVLGALLGVAACASVLTTGGYYFLSGRFAPVSIEGLMERLVTYSPAAVATTFAYGAIAVFVMRIIRSGVHQGAPDRGKAG